MYCGLGGRSCLRLASCALSGRESFHGCCREAQKAATPLPLHTHAVCDTTFSVTAVGCVEGMAVFTWMGNERNERCIGQRRRD